MRFVPLFRVTALALAVTAAALASTSARAEGFACDPGKRVLVHASRLPAVAAALERGRPVSILAIGSSSTEGAGATDRDHSYPARLQALLARRWPRSPVTVINAGIGGETAPQTLERLARELESRHYDLVIWQVGTNDAVRGENEAAFRERLEHGIHLVRDARADLVLMDPQDFPTVRDRPTYERFVRIIGEAGEANGVPVFSRYALMRAWAERGEDQLAMTLAPDRFHMNDTGYACVARVLSADLGDMARMGRAVAGGR
ncbi:SGNH/GDSL hydrolase family protein [Alsobacter sp. R-9]